MSVDREAWIAELLSTRAVVELVSNADCPNIDGAEGPEGIEDGPATSRPVEYSFKDWDTSLDLDTGLLIFHFGHTDADAHDRLRRIFEPVAEQNSLVLEALWFDDTGNSQIALGDPNLAE